MFYSTSESPSRRLKNYLDTTPPFGMAVNASLKNARRTYHRDRGAAGSLNSRKSAHAHATAYFISNARCRDDDGAAYPTLFRSRIIRPRRGVGKLSAAVGIYRTCQSEKRFPARARTGTGSTHGLVRLFASAGPAELYFSSVQH